MPANLVSMASKSTDWLTDICCVLFITPERLVSIKSKCDNVAPFVFSTRPGG